MILLTDEEIPYKPDNEKEEMYCDIGARDKSIYTEGAQAQLKKVVEQGEKLCEHGSYQLSRKGKDCPNCWNALKQEAGL